MVTIAGVAGDEDQFYCHVGIANTMGDSLSGQTNLYSALLVQ
jgi:hypothetical protein